ncbi:hypothetical protein [Glaciibacter psychrotolerans]|uniref:Uncharacterized protein n=1 Tax=Glaciibacter psychrotolerans TaxID=670054 RepID=A0A7Z0J6T0_9MICO|nr:hypothetical protein [Leifsonia psychrotolerans]NYJ20872.1 hypothetical protein [Leifsonia psychrotolerans]
MRTSRAIRTLRGTVAAAFATFVAVLSHIMGGGEMPGVWGVITPLALSIPLCVLLSGRQLTLWRLAGSVALSQFLFHTLFVLGTVPAGGTVPDLGPQALHGHGAHGLAFTLPSGDLSAADSGLADGGMWVAHALAALLTVAFLHRSETVFTSLQNVSRVVVSLLLPALDVPVLSPASRPRSTAALWTQLTLTPLGVFPSTVLRRGPPTAVCS